MGEGTFPKTQPYPHPWALMLKVPHHRALSYNNMNERPFDPTISH